jgi:pyruvate, water dikinase
VRPSSAAASNLIPTSLTRQVHSCLRQGRQKFKIVRGPNGADIEQALGEREVGRRTLSQAEIISIAELGLRAERHYGTPQDLEWARADGATYLVQSRPITTLGEPQTEARPTSPVAPSLLLSGLAASAGRASGRVRILSSPHRQAELLDGEVLVAEMTSPDWVPAMRRATALITDGGGVTCHAAIVSCELQLPCVVGTGNATTSLHTGQKSLSTVAPARCTPGAATPITVQRPIQPLPEPVPHWRPGCTSTWPLPNMPKKSPRCQLTASACYEPSSWWPTR